eukprot:UN23811
MLYNAIGGFATEELLPVHLDVGTNNEEFINDPFYFGIKELRSSFSINQYNDLLDEFMTATTKVFGKTTLVQFEDFGNSNAFRLLSRYREKFTMFNDDIQGTAAVTMAGIYASLQGKRGFNRLQDHKFLMVGAGSAALGIADIISSGLVEESKGILSLADARQRILLID